MTQGELEAEVDRAKDEAWRTARDNPRGRSPATNMLEARLTTIENTLAILVGSVSQPVPGAVTGHAMALVALRDYWEEVAEELKK